MPNRHEDGAKNPSPHAAPLPPAETLEARRAAALGRMAPNVAHDFNNVLGVIGNSMYLLERQTASLPAMQGPIAAAQRAVKNGSRLSAQLQRLSENPAPAVRPIALAVELQEIGDVLRTALGRRFELDVVVDAAIGRAIGDRSALELVLLEGALDARSHLHGASQSRLEAKTRDGDVVVALAPVADGLVGAATTSVSMPAESRR